MTWLKENWFKLAAIISGILYISILGYEQFRLTKAHNLDAVNSRRLCAELAGRIAVQNCSDAAEKQMINFLE